MESYLDHLGTFYDEKMKFLTRKEKFTKCNQCEKDKVFQETKEELLFTCGAEKGKCGLQIKITLPEYIHYETQITELKEKMNSFLNWDILREYIEGEEEFQEQETLQTNVQSSLFHIQQLFQEANIQTKQEALQRFYNQRVSGIKRCKEIKKQLQQKDLLSDKRKELHQEYISLTLQMNKDYQVTQELLKDMNPYLQVKPPNVSIQQTQYKETFKKKKPVKSIDFTNKDFIERFLSVAYQNGGIITKKEYNQNVRGQSKILWGSRLFQSLQLNEECWMKETQENIGNIIMEPSEKNPPQIKVSQEWMDYLTQEKQSTQPTQPTQPTPQMIQNPKISDIQENLKLKWSPDGQDELLDAVTDRIDKRLKTKVKIITPEGDKKKIKLSEIKELYI
jgi:hypothetical protein